MRDKKTNETQRKTAKAKGNARHHTPRTNQWIDRVPVADWTENATVADVERILWKCVFSVQRKKLTPKQSNAMVYALYRILECKDRRDFEQRLTDLENNQNGSDGGVIQISVGR